MGSLDESNQTSEDLQSEKATPNNGNVEEIVHPSIAHDHESTQIGSISFSSNSSSFLSDFSLEDLEVDDEHVEVQNKESSDPGTTSTNDCISKIPPIQVMERVKTSNYRIPSRAFTRMKSATPGNWSMASNESFFSIHMGGATFCHRDSYIFSPEFNLPVDGLFEDGEIVETDEVNSQGSSMIDEPVYVEDKENQPTEGETTEKGGSPIEVPEEPKLEPSDDKAEPPKSSPLTKWFPCFRYCACCS